MYELSARLTSQMCDMLRNYKNVKWLIVGCTDHPYISEHHKDMVDAGDVIFINYEDDLPGLYTICDIFLNPDRVGGGYSVAWAVQQGLAVASPSGGDAEICILGKDYCLPGEADLVPFIESLINDSELLGRKKEEYRQLTNQWDFEGYVGQLIAGINQLADEFEKTRKVECSYE